MGRTTAALTIGCVLGAGITGCRGTPKNPEVLRNAARSLAAVQDVDETAVLRAARAQAQTEDDQLRLIRQWQQELPPQPLPPLTRPVDTFASQLGERARATLKSAGCEAVVDIAAKGEVPTPQTFAATYLQDLALHGVPHAALLDIAEDFTELYEDAAAGDLRSTQVRMTLLKYEYCP